MNPGGNAFVPSLAMQFRDRVRGFCDAADAFLSELDKDIRRAEQRGLPELWRDLVELRHRLGVAMSEGRRLLDLDARR
jgi:hypothetical protein